MCWYNFNGQKHYRFWCISCYSNYRKEKGVTKRWYQKHKVENNQWQKNNPDKAARSTKKWQKNNPDKVKANRHVGRQKHRARKKRAVGTYTFNEWATLKAKYNNTCLRCGRKEPEIKLTADHVVPLSKGGDNYISNIQPLCHSCNSSKRAKTIDYRTQKETEQPLRQQKLF